MTDDSRRPLPERPPAAAAFAAPPPGLFGGGPADDPAGPFPARRGNPAQCSVCGVETDVPFVPDGVRPVYCIPCLKKRTR